MTGDEDAGRAADLVHFDRKLSASSPGGWYRPEVVNGGALEVATLLGHRDLSSGLRCLGSFARYSSEPVRLRIHDDGTLSEKDVAALRANLPVADVVSRARADSRANDEWIGFDRCRRLRTITPLALKLLDVTLFEPTATVRYVDSDVLFLRPFRNPLVDDPPAEGLFFPDMQSAYSIRHRDLLRLGLPRPARRLNTGVVRFPKSRFDLSRVERFLSGWSGYALPWIEQTCWALLAIDARTLSGRQAAIVDLRRRPTAETVALHFVSSVRAELASFQTTDRAAEPAVTIATDPCRPLGHLSLFLDRARRWLASRPSRPAHSSRRG
jgi:hypothetical protein